MTPPVAGAADLSRPRSILDLVGNTPLLRLRRFERADGRIQLYAKAEWKNPGGSVKDRAAVRMVTDGEASGLLTPGKTILDATSGNTGIAYAMIGAARGYAVKLCMPENVTPERKRILRAYGAELVLTDPLEGSDGAIREVRRVYAEDPNLYFYPDQYSNPANWKAHYDGTGPEILAQTDGRITHFVAGLGTSGTFMGTGRFLRDHKPGVTLVSVQPDAALHGLEGLKHMDSAIVPSIYDPSLADIDLGVGTEESYLLTKRLALEEGLLVGISSGAALAASLRLANTIDDGVIVTIFSDSGEKYLSERFWEEPPEGSFVGGVELTMRTSLHLAAGVADAIRSHGVETYPHECCGALVGRDGEVTGAVPLANTTDEGPRRRFLVRPSDYQQAERAAESRRRRTARLLSLASGPSGAALAV